MTNVPDNTDDLQTCVSRTEIRDEFAKRILCPKSPTRSSGIDNTHQWRAGGIVLGQCAPFEQRNPHRFKIIGRYHANGGFIIAVTAAQIERTCAVAPAEGQAADRRRRSYPRHSTQSLDDLLIKSGLLHRSSRGRISNVENEEALGLKTWIDMSEFGKALQHQSRADQQD